MPFAGDGPWWKHALETIGRLVGGRFVFLAGMALVAVGGALLGSAWRLGPAAIAEVRSRDRLTGRMEVEAVRPFWTLAAGHDPVSRELAWPQLAKAELCAELRPVDGEGGDWGTGSLGIVCGARRGGFGPWLFDEVTSLAGGVPIVWPRDDSGWPVVELRLDPGTLAYLREKPTAFWPLLGQSEEARTLMTQAGLDKGSEWDALWLELDRPLEWLLLAANAPPRATFALAFDPEYPGTGVPAGLLAEPPAEPLPWIAILVLAAVGGVAWWKGLSIAFHGQKRWALAAIAVGPLLLLPWWGNRFSEVVRRIAPGFGEPGLWLESALAEARRPPVEIRPEGPETGYERVFWTVEDSYYKEALAPFAPLAAREARDADAALAAATAAIGERLRAMDPNAQVALLDRLAWDEQLDRGRASLFFAPAAYALLEDATTHESVRQSAASFLFWHGVTPLGIDPAQPAFATRRAIWENLHTSTDPAVANTAGWVLERLAETSAPSS